MAEDTSIREQPAAQEPVQPDQPPIPPRPFFQRRAVRVTGIALACAFAAGLVAFISYYVKFARLIDQKLNAGPFSNTVNFYAQAQLISVGDAWTAPEMAARLERAGYRMTRGAPTGRYNLKPGAIEIFPGPESYFQREAALVRFSQGKISSIVSLEDNSERNQYQLEPLLIANLSESQSRSKRRLVRFNDIPPVLVNAVVSVEDKHFFRHHGFDLPRIVKAACVDLKEGRKEQGASTLSMQLARSLWLEPDKSWSRKIAELLMTLHLEKRLSKQQIFEYYANEVYLGRRGTFNVNGFGEAARAYLGKELNQITLPEAALLAGLIQRPAFYDPVRFPDRARQRRDLVIGRMQRNGYLSDTAARQAVSQPVPIRGGDGDSDGAPFFVDLVNEEIQNRLAGREVQSRAVYTTLDVDLQLAADEAVRRAMPRLDKLVRKAKRGKDGEVQVALIALDPHTGRIKALCGGRNYGRSQLDHILAQRQPGSIFKPFVYAAALETGLRGGDRILTAATTVDDEPATFETGGQTYQPKNFHHARYGTVTLKRALAKSINIATVKVAEMVGYDAVLRLAWQAGLNSGIQPTPAVALGAYDVSPLEMAGAYTVFANQGIYVRPSMISMVRGGDGKVVYRAAPETRTVLDPRVAFLMVDMLQEVLRSGTGAGIWATGFKAPAAGKTGTSRDGWFAGFTSQLLCVVWVGFDDNRDLGLEGAKSALPIWADFMKRALEYRPYRDVKPFRAPKGVVSAAICSDSGELASPSCPSTQSDFFIDGTQPVVGCPLHQAAPILVQNPNSALVPMGAAASADRSQAKNPDTPN